MLEIREQYLIRFGGEDNNDFCFEIVSRSGRGSVYVLDVYHNNKEHEDNHIGGRFYEAELDEVELDENDNTFYEEHSSQTIATLTKEIGKYLHRLPETF